MFVRGNSDDHRADRRKKAHLGISLNKKNGAGRMGVEKIKRRGQYLFALFE